MPVTRGRSRPAPTGCRRACPPRLRSATSTRSAKRVDALLEKTAAAAVEAKAARAAAKEESVATLTALAEEAEKLAGSSSWKDAGERLRNIGQDWKRVKGVDKTTADALWERVAASRARFTERRTTHFGALDEQRSGLAGAQAEAAQGGREARRRRPTGSPPPTGSSS